MRTRRNTAALLAYDVSSGVVISSKTSNRDSVVTEHVEEDDDDDDDEMDRNTFGPEKRFDKLYYYLIILMSWFLEQYQVWYLAISHFQHLYFYHLFTGTQVSKI
jgi:hypothetical protein